MERGEKKKKTNKSVEIHGAVSQKVHPETNESSDSSKEERDQDLFIAINFI